MTDSRRDFPAGKYDAWKTTPPDIEDEKPEFERDKPDEYRSWSRYFEPPDREVWEDR